MSEMERKIGVETEEEAPEDFVQHLSVALEGMGWLYEFHDFF